MVNDSLALQRLEFSVVEVALDPVVEQCEHSWLPVEGFWLLFFAFADGWRSSIEVRDALLCVLRSR